LTDRGHRIKTFLLVILFADLMALAARISVPVPPVPLTMQTLVALLSGALLGSRAGLSSQILYLAMGLGGLPVFATGGGLSYTLSPTFGYLVGFCGGAWLTGFLLERRPTGSYFGILTVFSAGLAVIYAIGLPYLYLNILLVQEKLLPLGTVLKVGLLLPLPGDLIKLLIAPPIAVRMNLIIHGFASPGKRA
jgi:biotin transport system substrate-specific component